MRSDLKVRATRNGELALAVRLLLFFAANPSGAHTYPTLVSKLDEHPEQIRRQIKRLEDRGLLTRGVGADGIVGIATTDKLRRMMRELEV